MAKILYVYVSHMFCFSLAVKQNKYIYIYYTDPAKSVGLYLNYSCIIAFCKSESNNTYWNEDLNLFPNTVIDFLMTHISLKVRMHDLDFLKGSTFEMWALFMSFLWKFCINCYGFLHEINQIKKKKWKMVLLFICLLIHKHTLDCCSDIQITFDLIAYILRGYDL